MTERTIESNPEPATSFPHGIFLHVIHERDIPYQQRRVPFGSYEGPSYGSGNAAFTLVSADDLLSDGVLEGQFRADENGNPLEPTPEEIADEDSLQPFAWELYKLALRVEDDIYIALDG